MVAESPAVGCCESAGGAADGAIAFRMALAAVLPERKRQAGLEVLIAYLIALLLPTLMCQVCLASVFFSVVLSLSTPTE